MPNTEVQDFLFLSHLVHSGEYNIRIRWGDVFEVLEKILKGNVRSCCNVVLERGYTNGCDNDDPFMLLRTPPSLSEQARGKLLSRLLEMVRQTDFALNVATLLYLQQSLMMGILESFYDHAIDFVDTPQDRVLISMVTSPRFLQNEEVAAFFEKHLDDFDIDLAPLHRYLD
ncbi:MAG: hypothetical protein P8Z70_07195, partial [Desulfuromonadales bacterium]